MLTSTIKKSAILFVAIACILAGADRPAHGAGLGASRSLTFLSPTVPPLPPPGPCGAAFSASGDIFDIFGGAIPMGPPPCGLAWAFGPGGNVDAFSSGQFAGPLPLPIPPGTFSLLFSVDKLATGDPFANCTTGGPGPLPPDVGSEACNLDFGQNPNAASTDAADDVYLTTGNTAPAGIGPVPGTMDHTVLLDGDGKLAQACPFWPVLASGLDEPDQDAPGALGVQPIDDVDALDLAPVSFFDTGVADGVVDVPVYYSVDPITAAFSAGAFAPGDVIRVIAGAAAVYAPTVALGLPAGADIDGLVVADALGDGVYAPFPGPDRILYSLTAASPGIGLPDCLGVPIGPGDILTEGSPLAFPGVPCIIVNARDFGLWNSTPCGPNPITTLGSDNLDDFDLVGPTVIQPVCGPAPLPDGSCFLADPVLGPGKSQIKIKNMDAEGKQKANSVSYKWGNGEALSIGDFQNPVATSTFRYRLCVYDSSGGAQPIYQKDIAPNGVVPLCSGKPCWKAAGTTGVNYKGPKQLRLSGSVLKAQLKAGDAGKTKVSVKVKKRFTNPPETSPLLPTAPVIVQFLITDGATTSCFKTTFPGAGGDIKKQDNIQFFSTGP